MVCGLTWLSLSQGKFRKHVRLVLLKLGISSISDGISHVILLLWLQVLWLVVDTITVIPCLGVSLFLIFTSHSVSRKVLLELFPNTTNYSHFNPVRKTLHWLPTQHLSLFNTILLVILIILNVFFNVDKMCTIFVV